MSIPSTRRDLREQARRSPVLPGDASNDAGIIALEPRRRRRVGRMLGDTALWIAAAAGTVCILLVVLAMTAGITLILFRTGSMSPTIPAGSVAIVQRIPATEVEVGDVVTVDREGELPVTHRVTSVAPGESDAERVLTLRGDANASDDPFPYTVSTVRIVLFSVPGIASGIAALGHPLVLGGLTAGATLLVVWAFWPHAPRRDRSTARAASGANEER